MNQEQATKIRAEHAEAQAHLHDYKAHHASPLGYWASMAEAETRLKTARAALDAAHLCECDNRRFDNDGKEPCCSDDTKWLWCGGYGKAWLCPEHAHIADKLTEDQLAAERQNGRNLAQMFKDERAMMRD